MAAAISSRSRGTMSRLCVGCGGQIHDQYILRVAPNLEWHAACLKCCECKKFLDESCTCFVREGKIYCKEDYLRLFGTKCEKCHHSFGKNDFVMRAKNKIFHLECFRCTACQKQLIPGEEFALHNDGELFCKEDTRHIPGCNPSNKDRIYKSKPSRKSEENNNSQDKLKRENNDEDEDEEIRNTLKGEDSVDPDDEMMSIKSDDEYTVKTEKCDSSSSSFPKLYDGKDDWGTAGKSPATIKRALSSADDTVSLDGSDESKSATGSIAGAPLGGGGSKVGPQQQQRRSRAGRVRTVLTEKQLTMMKGCYNANCRPDALMKEQLIEMTGLSGRVIRVWFQNKRCKDKKRSIRDTMQNKEGRKMGYGGMQGFPMVASSPMRQDALSNSPVMPPMGGGVPVGGPNNMNPIDIHSYEPPWKALCDFALHSDLDRLNPNTQPHYQHLINQMHGYDYRTGVSTGIPPHPPNSGPIGPPPMGHMGPQGIPGGPDRIYQPPPPGLENSGQIPAAMGDPMGIGVSGRPMLSDGGSIMPPHDGYMGDNLNMGPGHSSGLCGLENTSMIPQPIESSGYTLTSLDANSPMGSES